MYAYLYLAAFDVTSILSGTYLVVNNHAGWGFFCFLLAATTSIKVNKS